MIKKITAVFVVAFAFAVPLAVVIASISEFTRSDWFWFLIVGGALIVLIISFVWGVVTLLNASES